MSRPVKVVRQLISIAIALPLLVLGVILIPLPGPGVLVCFIALYVLSREFTWAEKHYKRAQVYLKKIYATSKARADKIAQSE